MSRLGKMPSWQKSFVYVSMISCSFTGCLYLLGYEFHFNKTLFGSHSVLAWHGMTAMLATLALGSILPFHLKAGLKAKRRMLSGVSQLSFLLTLLISGALLYYGPEAIRATVISTHSIVGLLFFASFMYHGIIQRSPLKLAT